MYQFLEGVLLFSLFGVISSLDNKICTDDYQRNACNNIVRNNVFECAENIPSKTECFINMDQGLPQFAIANAEEALLAAPLVSDNVVVIATVAAVNPPYQTVVIVRNNSFSGGFDSLRGKRFCHPGYKHDELVSRYVLEELDSKILNVDSQYCSIADNITIVEKRMKALNSFFDRSCRPGPWTEDNELDAKWKSTYSNLCDLCGDSKCNTTYQMPFNDTLTCLTQSNGDIALTTLRDATVFFNNSVNIGSFVYLCPDGTVRNNTSPCIWTQQLDRVIVSGREIADTARAFITPLLEKTGDLQLQALPLRQSLEQVLNIRADDNITYHDPAIPLKTYVESRRSIPNPDNSKQCNTTVKWCTLNYNEQQKCLWLRQASLNAGIQPLIECVQSSENESYSCIETIKSGVADIAFIDVNYGYTALQKGLTVVAYPETDTRQLSSILIVMKNDTTDIKSLSDLRGKSACLPEYSGKEWLAFIDFLRATKTVPNSCDYEKLFSDFVSDSCVPGARSDYYKLEEEVRSKLCQHCTSKSYNKPASYCNADGDNKYFTSNGALRCLLDGSGAYAVVTVNDVTEFNETSMLRVLSKNGSLSDFQFSNSSQIDSEAPITIITAGEVVARNDSALKGDIVLLLRDIEAQFGENLMKNFDAFVEFNKTKDLIFPDSTPGLTFTGDSNKYVENFKSLLRNSEKCLIDPSSEASAVLPSTIMMLIGLFILRN